MRRLNGNIHRSHSVHNAPVTRHFPVCSFPVAVVTVFRRRVVPFFSLNGPPTYLFPEKGGVEIRRGRQVLLRLPACRVGQESRGYSSANSRSRTFRLFPAFRWRLC